MKKFIVFALGIGITVLFAGVAAAQFATATDSTTSATVDIVAPIAIAHTADLRFGEVISTLAIGTVVMTPAGVRSATGGAYLGTAPGGPASFDVTGEGASTYTITLPADGVVTITGPGAPMAVDTFTSTPSGTGALTAGAQTLTVGATLDVGISQVPGTYTGTFSVTVAYN